MLSVMFMYDITLMVQMPINFNSNTGTRFQGGVL